MTLEIGGVYTVRFKSGNTHTAFNWNEGARRGQYIPASGNKFMENKIMKLTGQLTPVDSLDYDYTANIYDKIDGAIEHKDIKIVSNQLILSDSTYKIAGYKKKTKKTKKRKKTKKTKKTKKRKGKRTKKRKGKRTKKGNSIMKGGSFLHDFFG
tara:strand:+ start:82 stop:540 length:459 start_codon:yes stop_codon:yes gene_type:complete